MLFYRETWDSSFLKYFKILAGRVLMTLIMSIMWASYDMVQNNELRFSIFLL